MVALVANLAMINVVITVSGMWLRQDVEAAYISTRVFIKGSGLGRLDPKLVKKRWENLIHKYKVRLSLVSNKA